ncbi:MAG: radical SAM protein [Candidatus Schekmanbacteria bacterium]|nr:radical SAM protein [Candidatus Schekmanbacteria bacterium]
MSAYTCQQKNYGHPCFGGEAHHNIGRIHLAVAPSCNIKCKYCTRRHDCANENRPGVASKVLSPAQALEWVKQAVKQDSRIKVVGIAGPGDPLANETTFETFRLVHQEFPDLIKCLSTNGLLLPDRLDDLTEAGVSSLTVTINAIDPWIGEKIYSWVKYRGRIFYGRDAASLLSTNQLLGVSRAIEHGLRLKVNSVLIPGLNDRELPELARILRDLGVSMMNIMPLIPQADLAHFPAPAAGELSRMRDECEKILPQFRHCKQCRADAVGLL